MGGGANSTPPSDQPPGGGTFPTNAFGTAYNPAQSSSFTPSQNPWSPSAAMNIQLGPPYQAQQQQVMPTSVQQQNDWFVDLLRRYGQAGTNNPNPLTF